MKFLSKGILCGLVFVATYFFSNFEPVNRVFEGLGVLYHPARALVMFTIGYFLGALTTRR